MLFSDTYFTIETASEGIYRDRGSKFIGAIFPVKTDTEIKEILSRIKKENPGANHNCYAYRLGADGLNYRANDDGEPSGTAGKPIYNQILSHDLTDVLIVVTRYFGGTLLGASGLINAYKSAAAEAITNSKIIEKNILFVYEVHFGFGRMNEIMRILKDNHAKVQEQDYGDGSEGSLIKITFTCAKKYSEKLEEQLNLLFDISFKFLRQE